MPFLLRLTRASHQRYGVASIAIIGMLVVVAFQSLVSLVGGFAFRLETGSWSASGNESDPWFELGTSLGFWGFAAFLVNLLIASRWGWVERAFGGLDRAYRIHTFLGRTSFLLLVLHWAILVGWALPDYGLAARYTIPGLDLSFTLGLLGLAAATVLIAASIWVRLPYDTWLSSHRWMGIPYLLGGAHALVSQGDWYVGAMTVVGGFAWWSISFGYARRSGRVDGRIDGVRHLGAITEMSVTTDRPHRFEAGSFAFVAVTESRAGIASERHPFTVSRIDGPNRYRISAKRIGDYTRSLERIVVGDRISAHGPHGSFGARALSGAGNGVWIAGGIGITPFLALLEALPENARVTLLWSVREREEAVYEAEIAAIAERFPGVRYHLHVSGEEGRLDAGRIAAAIGAETVASADRICLCGPDAMTRELGHAVVRLGAPPDRVVTESFGFR